MSTNEIITVGHLKEVLSQFDNNLEVGIYSIKMESLVALLSVTLEQTAEEIKYVELRIEN